jgi:hypothetical protein
MPCTIVVNCEIACDYFKSFVEYERDVRQISPPEDPTVPYPTGGKIIIGDRDVVDEPTTGSRT